MPAPIVVTTHVVVPESAIEVSAARSGGPGGQNVNKVASKVDVRVDVEAIAGLDTAARARLRGIVVHRLDAAGKLQVTSQKTRDQGKNLQDAYEKIRVLVAKALVVPKDRRPTRPSRAAVRRRLNDKRQASERKRGRARAGDEG